MKFKSESSSLYLEIDELLNFFTNFPKEALIPRYVISNSHKEEEGSIFGKKSQHWVRKNTSSADLGGCHLVVKF